MMKKNEPRNMHLDLMDAYTSTKTDAQIGMPDVEQELLRVQRQAQARSTSALRKVAASVAIALFIGGIAVAAIIGGPSLSRLFTPKPQPPTELQRPAGTANHSLGTVPATAKEAEAKPDTLSFDNAELKDIMQQVALIYKVHVSFERQQPMHLRLHFQLVSTEKIEEVVARLNMFEAFHATILADTPAKGQTTINIE